MIIAACNCGQAITGEDRATVTEAISAHLYKSPTITLGAATVADHSALIGEADARLSLTVITEEAGAIGGIGEVCKPVGMTTPEFEAFTAKHNITWEPG